MATTPTKTVQRVVKRRGRPRGTGGKVVVRQPSVIPREPLAKELQRLIRVKELSQTAAAAIVQDAPSQMSLLMGGHLDGFSAERLVRMLLRLNRDIEITVRRATRPTHPGRVSIVVQRDRAAG